MSVKDDRIITEAKKRFKACEEWESSARANFSFDMKFANGDSTNMYQWPQDIASSRGRSNKPCLTMNSVRPHNLQIVNDARENQSQIRVRPAGGHASFQAADVLEGIIRHIEYQSNAIAAYEKAIYDQVFGGIGYFRIVTDWLHDGTFDQDIYIRRIVDPMSVYLDPDIQEADGSDAKFGFVFKEMTDDEFKSEYSEYESVGNQPALGAGSGFYDGWQGKDHVRVCEYYRRSDRSDKLHLLDNGDTVKESDVKQAGLMEQLKTTSVKTRDIAVPQIEWYLIAGSEIIDRKEWPGTYIPIVRVVGEETVIDKTLDRKGHTRSMVDAQRLYNFWASSAAEHVALQTKSPFIASVEAINGFERNWASANVDNAAYLPYNGIKETGEKIERPERAPPPQMAEAYLSGMKLAQDDIMRVSGQYEASMGVKSNEVSGTAVNARQRQGEIATYHFIDRFSQAIRFAGRILIDLIPKIYDTERVIKVLALDGTQNTVQVDPNHPVAHQQLQDPNSKEFDPEAIAAIFNPTVGRYDVQADIGPAYGTRREETFNAITQILKGNPQVWPVVGDIMMRAADFPMADELAERLFNLVPKQALGNEPDPQVVQLQQQLAQLHQIMTSQGEELQAAKSKQVEIEQQKSIDTYRAETERMKAVGAIDPAAMMPIIRQMVSEVLGTPANPIIAAHKYEDAMMTPQVAQQPDQGAVAHPQPQQGQG